MKIKESPGRRLFVILNGCFLAIIGFCCLAPLIHVLACSISEPLTLAREKGFLLWPLGTWTFDGYVTVLSYDSIITGYANTLLYVFFGTLINLAMTSISAYVLSRKRFLCRNAIMLFFSFTMLFNGGMIPNFLLIRDLGLFDTRLSLLLPSALSVYNLIILRTAFMGIPDSLEESAQLDGANDLQILWHIILPVSKASVAVIALFVAVSFWNSWFSASIYLLDRNKWPLQLFLREILIANSLRDVESGARPSVLAMQTLVKYATIIVATIPILCVYPFVQRYFVKGVMIGAVKG